MFDSEMRAVWLSARNASVAARHFNPGGHSASGVAKMGAGFDLLNEELGACRCVIGRYECRLVTA
jgi:hypothetical protein